MSPGAIHGSDTVFCWGVKLTNCVKNGQNRKALDLFQTMQAEGVKPNSLIFVLSLKACANSRALEEGRLIHKQIIESGSGCESNIFLGNGLINMYAKCGRIEEACRVFNNLPARDAVSWNSLLMAYVKHRDGAERALELYSQMQQQHTEADNFTFAGVLQACASMKALEQGKLVHAQFLRSGHKADAFVSTSLMEMYTKCGCIEDAYRVFIYMAVHNVVTWTAMIMGFVQCGKGDRALELFKAMQQQGVEPNSITFMGALNACACLGALDEGKLVHAQIKQRRMESDLYIGSCLINMYTKCGSIADAWVVFNSMPKKDMVSWNIMLMGFGMHGLGNEALRLLEQMLQEGLETNSSTFISLLQACNHAGLVDEGCYFFEFLAPIYGVQAILEHYSSMVDIFGRSGFLNEAEDMIRSMFCLPDACVWMSLLGACTIHGNVEIGERAAKELLQLDPENTSAYVSLSKVYGGSTKFDTSAQIRN
ncbi:hypothetical protein O6H91_06G085600 [Diphasiastrum complanatum]|nr:hypothetical protein O6H91_06G085600 [Diphasiastrum complanatum]